MDCPSGGWTRARERTRRPRRRRASVAFFARRSSRARGRSRATRLVTTGAPASHESTSPSSDTLRLRVRRCPTDQVKRPRAGETVARRGVASRILPPSFHCVSHSGRARVSTPAGGRSHRRGVEGAPARGRESIAARALVERKEMLRNSKLVAFASSSRRGSARLFAPRSRGEARRAARVPWFHRVMIIAYP